MQNAQQGLSSLPDISRKVSTCLVYFMITVTGGENWISSYPIIKNPIGVMVELVSTCWVTSPAPSRLSYFLVSVFGGRLCILASIVLP